MKIKIIMNQDNSNNKIKFKVKLIEVIKDAIN